MLASQQEALQILRERAQGKGTASQRKDLFERIPKEGELTRDHAYHLRNFFADAKGSETLREESSLLLRWIDGELP